MVSTELFTTTFLPRMPCYSAGLFTSILYLQCSLGCTTTPLLSTYLSHFTTAPTSSSPISTFQWLRFLRPWQTPGGSLSNQPSSLRPRHCACSQPRVLCSAVGCISPCAAALNTSLLKSAPLAQWPAFTQAPHRHNPIAHSCGAKIDRRPPPFWVTQIPVRDFTQHLCFHWH